MPICWSLTSEHAYSQDRHIISWAPEGSSQGAPRSAALQWQCCKFPAPLPGAISLLKAHTSIPSPSSSRANQTQTLPTAAFPAGLAAPHASFRSLLLPRRLPWLTASHVSYHGFIFIHALPPPPLLLPEPRPHHTTAILHHRLDPVLQFVGSLLHSGGAVRIRQLYCAAALIPSSSSSCHSSSSALTNSPFFAIASCNGERQGQG